MKKLITLIIVASLALTIQAQDITNTPASGGDFIITSTTGGILIPKMTMTQRDAITGHVEGLMIYQTDNTAGFYYYSGSAWILNGNSSVAGIDDLSDAIAGSSNVFLGLNAGSLTTGTHNVALGLDALKATSNGIQNAAFGASALNANTGNYNVAIGSNSLSILSSGDNNIALGIGAGRLHTGGSNNILIGGQVEPSSTTVSNELNIGDIIYGTGLDGTGKVGIGNGNNAPSSTLDVDGTFEVSGNAALNGTLEVSGKATLNDVLHLTPVSSAPGSPTEGDIYVNSADHHIYCYLNSTWVQLD